MLALASVLGASALVASCLPTLSTVSGAPSEAGSEATAPTATCGDGIIQADAGEQCDPGAGGSPGCSKACKIACPDALTGGFVDPDTLHCYFLLNSNGSSTTNATADDTHGGCRSMANAAHVVTIGDEKELATLTRSTLLNPSAAFWIGLQRNVDMLDAGSVAWVSQNYFVEPGWAPNGSCPGCFAVTQTPPPSQFPTMPDANVTEPGCVVDSKTSTMTWFGLPCSGSSSSAGAICEREPVGSRATPCGAGNTDYCITLPPKIMPAGIQSYEYHPSPVDAVTAESTCMQLGGTLVVFPTVDVRQALDYQLETLPSGEAPHAYWIGLSRPTVDSPASSWTWDDDTPVSGTYPNPWGIAAPETPGETRAYTVFYTTSSPVARVVDTQLAHASVTTAMPFVCQNPM